MFEFNKLWLLLAATWLFARVTVCRDFKTTEEILGSGQAEAAVGTREAIDIFPIDILEDGGEWDTLFCTSSTCGRNGRCYMTTFGFVCKCDAGYVGERCNSRAFAVQCDADYCNGGTCTVLKSGFRSAFHCTCLPGFFGETCDILDPCISNPCQHNGQCRSNAAGEVACECSGGYQGEHCEMPYSQCHPDRCANGLCTVVQGKFQCTCLEGWSGELCNVMIQAPDSENPCNSQPRLCRNGGTCFWNKGNMGCHCRAGFRGILCERRVPRVQSFNPIIELPAVQPCSAQPCFNGGTCNVVSLNSFTCTCARGFVGGRCQTPSKPVSLLRPSPCSSNPCPTGLCVDIGGGIHECRVRIGRPRRGPCDNNPCMNGGICTVIGLMTFQCNCKRGWDGHRCNSLSSSTDVCAYKPCKNGGRCSAVNGQFKCTCIDGWIGPDCNQPAPTPCSVNPCFNGGTCAVAVPGSNSFICTCAPGYAGSRCRTLTDPCGRDNQCYNGGTCQPFRGSNSFICTCAYGYAGKRCETRTDPCAGKPCHNGGTCRPVSGYNTFKCTCAPGYTGGRCGTLTATDPCAGNPCQNGATCSPARGKVVFRANRYNCTCVLGFEGKRCEDEITTLCPSNICKNEALCVISGAVSQCICNSGYGGSLCEISPITQIDHCNPNPCKNQGRCRPYRSLFMCTCTSEWTGRTCETDSRTSDPSVLPSEATTRVCDPNPCKGGCSCYPSCRHELGYYCRGENGFLGKNCDIPASEVDCGADTVTISVDNRVVAEYGGVMDTSTIFMDRGSSMLPTPSCPATRRGSNFIITLSFPFTACGAVVSTGSNGKTIVSNKVWMNRLIGGPKADMPIPLVHFICEYGRQYSVVTSLTPSISRPPTINNTVEGSANIELCKTSDCPALCPQVYSMTKGAVYTVGQTIHLRFTASIQGIDIRLLNLFLSCDSDSNTASKLAAVVLTANGCLPDRDRRYLPTEVRPQGASICASFPVAMLTECSEFYIHALLSPCTTDCLAPYKSCARRSKRSNSETLNGANRNSPFQVFGPITVIQGEHGLALLLEFNENGTDVDVVPIQKPEKEILSDDSISPPLYIALVILLAVAVTMFAVLFALNWRRIDAHCGRKL